MRRRVAWITVQETRLAPNLIWSSFQAPPCFVTLPINTHGVQKHGLVQAQTSDLYLDNVARPRQPRFTVSHAAMALELLVVEPAVHQRKVPTAVVDLRISVRHKLAMLEDHDLLCPSVPHSRQVLRRMHS